MIKKIRNYFFLPKPSDTLYLLEPHIHTSYLKKGLYCLLLFFFCFIGSGFSQEILAADPSAAIPGAPSESVAQPTIVQELTAITLLSLLPFAIMLLTSYIKITIVLSLLRNALGVQQSPPNQVISGIALLMTIYVMFPTCLAMYQASEAVISSSPPQQLFSTQSADYVIRVVEVAKEPLKTFLLRNASNKHITSFYQLAYRSFPDGYRQTLKPTDFIVVIPAFITSQLKAAFEVGVLIYLPFFVIDLVTANILLAMGMMMLSPLTIALPLKLLLIVMVDGWTLIIQGLVLSFK
ncbi:MAG: type III secretion system export apparatus subunit SctR [Chlamydiales bacterium]|nr:type III secretion system export apparatus subunit SctR [Chlamydiales bacterium]